jgi:hypothetical protein
MTKWALFLTLAIAQLLSGSGGNVYLCVKNDGSCYCVDAGPESCTCGSEREGCQQEACCEGTECEGGKACGNHCSASCSEQHQFAANDPCQGCSHIPLLISAEQPTSVSRASTELSEAQRVVLFAASNPVPRLSEFSPTGLEVRRSSPPTVRDFSLTMLSTVVIRC